jgi:ABC-type phosphate transport system auxiliary subunit
MGMDSPGGMHDMPGMDGDTGGMADGGMMAEMQQHMQRMMGAGTDSMRAMMPMHRQMTANMLSRLNREMRDMNMQADAAWSATMDSLRSDLATMAAMDPAELQALMPGHHRRAMRLMDMHREMMAGMQM